MGHRGTGLLLLGFVATPLGGCASTPRGSVVQETPSSVILLVADGAGLAHWTLAAYGADELAVQRMSIVGLVDTRGADHTVSASAPTATAYATGVRSRIGYVGVDADGQPRTSVLEAAMEADKSTGLITTTSIVNATPAAFAAHHIDRGASGLIARQMAEKGIDVLMGGGRAAFRPEAQTDGVDLLARLRDTYTYLDDAEALATLDADTVDALLGLFAEGGMGTVSERGEALSWMTATALEILGDDPDGFFLLVENEETDTQAHRNADPSVVTTEMLDFDKAVGLALDYRDAHPGTLVLVTADHETGGLTLTHDREREIVTRYATTNHTGTLVPLFAAGPGAERFSGIIRNDEVGRIVLEMMGWVPEGPLAPSSPFCDEAPPAPRASPVCAPTSSGRDPR